jgi:hypothetical protein
MDELGQIGGVGKKKKEEYGASLLYTVIKFLQDEQVQLNGATMPRLPPKPSIEKQSGGSGGSSANKRSGDGAPSQRQPKKANNNSKYFPGADSGNMSDDDAFQASAPSQQPRGYQTHPPQPKNEFDEFDDIDYSALDTECY